MNSNDKTTISQNDNALIWENGRTDNANATRFIDRNHSRVRFIPEWDKWCVWDGRRWKLDFKNVTVTKLARTMVDNLWDDYTAFAKEGIDRDKLDPIRTFIKKSNQQKSIGALIHLARSDDRTTLSFECLNNDPFLLNVQNGTVNLRTGELQPHNPDDNITQLANVKFDATAHCSEWQDTLDIIFDGDQELIEYVQLLLGYSISGDRGEHILPLCQGKGENGKSTLWNPIIEILGDYACLANDSLILGDSKEHATEKAALYQMRFVAISEPDEDVKLKEARVKELTGDDYVTCRRMREDFWTFKRTHTFWISTNHLPNIRGIQRRA